MLLRVVTLMIACTGASVLSMAQPHLLRERAVALEATDPAEAARFYYQAGKGYDEAYKIDSALAVLIHSRDLYHQLDSAGSLGEAMANHALGDIYKYVLYDFNAAEQSYERALAIQQVRGPEDVRNITRLYYNLATTNRSQLDYEKAIGYSYRAIAGALSMSDQAFLERTYSVLGNIYRDMHQYDSAGVYYQRGIAVNRTINKGKQNETLAGFLSGWGDAFYRQGMLTRAAETLSEAVAIYDRLKTGDKLLHFHATRLLAEVQMKGGHAGESLRLLQKAERIHGSLGLTQGGPASSLYKSFGDYYKTEGQPVVALGYYQRSLQATLRKMDTAAVLTLRVPSADEISLKGFAYDALLARAEAHRDVYNRMTSKKFDRKGEIMMAIDCYRLAARLMAKSRMELDSEDARWNFVDAHFQLYENALTLLDEVQEVDSASELTFHFIESSKSKTLADALQEVELKKTISRNDTLLPALRRLKQRAIALQHRVDEKNETSVRGELIETEKSISTLESKINQLYPGYLKIKNESPTVSLPLLRQRLRALDATMVEYFWGEQSVFAFVIPPDSTGHPRLFNLGRPGAFREHIAKLVAFYGQKVNRYSSTSVQEFAAGAGSLHRLLLAPFADELSPRKRLIVVPDGPIGQVPFETLVVTEPGQNVTTFNRLHYVLNDHIVSYAFSGSYLLAPQKRARRNPSVLAFGFTSSTDVRSDEPMNNEIAGTVTELNTLHEKFPEGTVLYGSDVTEKKFKDVAGSFDLLHLAVHGSGDTEADYSATLYFRDTDGQEDGRLYWYEMYGMSLQASLAVLSSCESGIGKSYRGEGMLSMANAFTFAGCSNIVMGLWKVDDQVSVKLMNTFYSELINGMAIDEALAMAKRTYLASADQVSANPKLWGSLVAYGETPILTADKIHTGWFILAMTVLVGAIILLVVKTKKK